ncbi:MAG: hypothetical protein RR490_06610 [Niameybacter sp.]
MAESRWQDIYLHLKSKGVKVYSPAQHIGECKEPYVVLKDTGATKMIGYSSAINMFDVMCYVPQNKFSLIEIFTDRIKSYMKELESKISIRPTFLETPSFYDEEIKGHMISIQYQVYKQIN